MYPNVLMCQSVSYTRFNVILVFLPAERRNGVSRVRLRVTLLTKSSRETDLISTSGLHPANVACQSTLRQFLVPPSEEYILMDQSLKSAQARPIISYWMKTPLRPTVIQTNVQGGNQKHLNPVIYYL